MDDQGVRDIDVSGLSDEDLTSVMQPMCSATYEMIHRFRAKIHWLTKVRAD